MATANRQVPIPSTHHHYHYHCPLLMKRIFAAVTVTVTVALVGTSSAFTSSSLHSHSYPITSSGSSSYDYEGSYARNRHQRLAYMFASSQSTQRRLTGIRKKPCIYHTTFLRPVILRMTALAAAIGEGDDLELLEDLDLSGDVDNDLMAGDEDDDPDEDGEDDEELGSDVKNAAANDYDAAVDINADIEIEEEDDEEEEEFDLGELEDEEDEDYDDDGDPEEKVYEEPTQEQLDEVIAENELELASIDVSYIERKNLNDHYKSLSSAVYDLAGDYGGERSDASETSPWYLEEDEIDDGEDWSYTALMLSAIKRNPDMPFVRPAWFNKVRIEKGLPELSAEELMTEQYRIEFTEDEVDAADASLVEKFFNMRGKLLPAPDDTSDPDYDQQQEMREFYMARIKVAEAEEDDGEDLESLEARWQAWFEEVYEEEELSEQFRLINQDEENMREDYHWHERYRHLEERCLNEGLNAKLVIAIKGDREDLKKCQMVTDRMKSEFGDELYVETQVFPEATSEDYLFEVWIVAYEDELLFSRRRHYYDQDWPGPDDFRSEDLDKLVEEVRFHLSDDAKNGFLFH
mmetsp:Transcript_7921/g.10120  ORF Transcript_7921/g.10120 Transcript_7921/m.10120 type:complete len:576 (-) Transcript_7921:31-1758(-)